MQNTPQPLDIVAVVIAVASLLFGPSMAAIVGPYAVIFLGAVVGAVYSASGRVQTAKIGTFAYCALMVVISVAVTVPVAELAAPYIRITESRSLFFPVSAAIAGVGDKWPGVFAWAWSLVRSIAERRAGTTPNEPPQGGPQ